MQTYHSSQRGWSCVCIEVCRPTDSFLLNQLTRGRCLRNRIINRCRGTRRHHVICWIWSVTSSSGSRRSMWSDLGGMKRGRPSRQWHSLKKKKKHFLGSKNWILEEKAWEIKCKHSFGRNIIFSKFFKCNDKKCNFIFFWLEKAMIKANVKKFAFKYKYFQIN